MPNFVEWPLAVVLKILASSERQHDLWQPKSWMVIRVRADDQRALYPRQKASHIYQGGSFTAFGILFATGWIWMFHSPISGREELFQQQNHLAQDGAFQRPRGSRSKLALLTNSSSFSHENLKLSLRLLRNSLTKWPSSWRPRTWFKTRKKIFLVLRQSKQQHNTYHLIITISIFSYSKNTFFTLLFGPYEVCFSK